MSLEDRITELTAAIVALTAKMDGAAPAVAPKGNASKPVPPAKPADTPKAAPANPPADNPNAGALVALRNRAVKLWDKHSAPIKAWCSDKGAPEGKINNLDPQHYGALDAYLKTLEQAADSADI